MHVGRVANQATLQRGVEAVATKHMYAIDEDGSANVEEALDNEERSASMVYVRRKRICAVARGDQQTRRRRREESQSIVIVECGERSTIRTQRKSLK